jgi:hypothetical protein
MVRFVMPTQTREIDLIALVYARLQHLSGALPAEDGAREWIDGLGNCSEGQAFGKLKGGGLDERYGGGEA